MTIGQTRAKIKVADQSEDKGGRPERRYKVADQGEDTRWQTKAKIQGGRPRRRYKVVLKRRKRASVFVCTLRLTALSIFMQKKYCFALVLFRL